MKNLIPDLDIKSIFAARIGELLTELQVAKSDVERLAIVGERGPELVQLYGQLQLVNTIRNRASHVADMASSFCHTAVETTEDENSMRQVAKRAVQLAHYIISESERFHGLSPFSK